MPVIVSTAGPVLLHEFANPAPGSLPARWRGLTLVTRRVRGGLELVRTWSPRRLGQSEAKGYGRPHARARRRSHSCFGAPLEGGLTAGPLLLPGRPGIVDGS